MSYVRVGNTLLLTEGEFAQMRDTEDELRARMLLAEEHVMDLLNVVDVLLKVMPPDTEVGRLERDAIATADRILKEYSGVENG